MNSQYEQRQLKRIERGLELTDPDWVALMSGRRTSGRKRTLIHLLVAASGILCASVGALITSPLLVLMGFLGAMSAICLHTARGQSTTGKE